jgi:4-amino-4-deoxy-L-arabinose transferase-like glycosyltransferase
MDNPHAQEPTGARPVSGFALTLVLLFVFAIRLLHLAYALRSPLTYQPGPDEDFYLQYGRALAHGQFGGAVEASMDPGYSYALAAVFHLLGPGLFGVYFLQICLDTATAFGVYLVGKELGRPRAGLIGAAVYGLTSTAILMATTALKEIWVANFMVLWVALALVLLRRPDPLRWLLLGLLCGLGTALRSNLVLMAIAALLLLPWLARRQAVAWPVVLKGVAALVLGLALPLLLLSLRNERLVASFSPLPTQGGLVLHQLYNEENPQSLAKAPHFVAFYNPVEIWIGYAREAERRQGRPLAARAVDRYWGREAVAYVRAHPRQSLDNALRKLKEFLAYEEVANNRSMSDERLFSPVLRGLPLPFAWLFALGVPGLYLLLRADRRALVLLAPIVAVVATVAVFFAEDRFRFPAAPLFALGAGALLDALLAQLKERRWRSVAMSAAAAIAIGAASLWCAHDMPRPAISWDRVAWGYIRMGRLDAAQKVALQHVETPRPDSSLYEALAYVAVAQGRDEDALGLYLRAIALRPGSHVAHYNLARLLARHGQREMALREAKAAAALSPDPDYLALVRALEAR